MSLLSSCDPVMDLTLMEDCLVCGAYEAVSVGKPLILSDTSALRRHFRKGAVYTLNMAGAIAEAINQVIVYRDRLVREVNSLKDELEPEWRLKLVRLTSLLETMVTKR